MKCPKCRAGLNEVTIKIDPGYGGAVLNDAEVTREIVVDQCLSCNGVWFDAGELKQYMDEKQILLDSNKVSDYKALDKKKGNCPRCDLEMQQKKSDISSSVMIDFCEKCQGIWLDSTELDQLEKKNFKESEKILLVLRDFCDDNFIKRMFKKGD